MSNTSLFDRLNLRPQERRLVVIVAVVMFVMLNIWLVRPHFGDLGKAQADLAKSRKAINVYKDEIVKLKDYETKLKKLEGEGTAVQPEDQAAQLLKTIQTQGIMSGVQITQARPVIANSTKTNEFFEEKHYAITMIAGDKELLGFLVALGRGDSIIRVKDMNLKPDVTGIKLQVSMTLVASYQRAAPKAVTETKTNATAMKRASEPTNSRAAGTNLKGTGTPPVRVGENKKIK